MEHPRVGLLTNGTEEHKGDTLHQEAHQLLKANPNIEFAGNIEGRDIMFGDVDVAVADGFSGNIALKSVEGCGKTVSAILKREFKKNLASKLAYLCARKHLPLRHPGARRLQQPPRRDHRGDAHLGCARKTGCVTAKI